MAPGFQNDIIVIGAGMGGLSAAAFLAKEGKKVLVIEKHDKPGGYVTSFTRGGYTFDSSIAHLNEMGENQTIRRFVKYWGGDISSRRLHFKLRYFIGDKEYLIDTRNLLGDLSAHFPSKRNELERFFSITERINREASGSGPMKVPSDMTLLDKLLFVVGSFVKKPTMMKYGMKSAVEVLSALFGDKHLETIIWAFYPINSLNFIGETWGWEMMRRGDYYYPDGGMQAIPSAAVEAIRQHGGDVILNTEVKRIIARDKKAVGVECVDGETFYSDVVISNSPIHHTLFRLCAHIPELDGLRRTVARRKVFTSLMGLYMGVDEGYDFHGVDYFFFLDEDTKDIPEKDLTPEDCPILMMVPPVKPGQQRDYSVIAGAILPYEYKGNWGTGESGKRGQEYYALKEQATNTVVGRIRERMGDGFGKALKYTLAATPLTFERYTYNAKGSIMGWGSKGFGKFLPYETPVENLYLVGQWVFPGGGVPAVMGSGYYVAQRILRKSGIDLEARMKESLRG